MLLLLAQPALPDTDLDTCTMPYVRLQHRSLFFFFFFREPARPFASAAAGLSRAVIKSLTPQCLSRP